MGYKLKMSWLTNKKPGYGPACWTVSGYFPVSLRIVILGVREEGCETDGDLCLLLWLKRMK